MLWYGTVATIPSGWHLCDGTTGTPDLANKFVLGAGSPVPPPNLTGGASVHNHDFTGDGHAHDLAAGNNIIDSTPAGDIAHQTTVSPAVGSTDSDNHIPPYRTLCYIMKLPIP